jgi:hypothetical protein
MSSEVNLLWPCQIPIEIEDDNDDAMTISSDEEDLELVLEEVDTTRKTEDGISLEQLRKLEKIRSNQKLVYLYTKKFK